MLRAEIFGKIFFTRLIAISCIIFLCSVVEAQSSLPTAQIKTLRGAIIPFSSAIQKDSLILVCFWSTTSDMSIDELNAINSKFEKWKEGLSFKLMAVAVDEGKTVSRVRGMVNANDWKFDVYIDINGELRNALKSSNLPQAIIIKNNKVIYQQSGYEQGTEDYLYKRMRAIAAGQL
jgi:cytochrome c biogenesis protein CcmG/thiol:disulfide interchange protein DsbE